LNATTTALKGPDNRYRAQSRPRSVLFGLCLGAGMLTGCGGFFEGSENSDPASAAIETSASTETAKASDRSRAGSNVAVMNRGEGGDSTTYSPPQAGGDPTSPQASGDSTSPQPGGGSTPTQPGGGATPTQPGGGATPTQPGGGSTPTQPGSGSTPTQPGSTINSLDTIVNDMKLKNDLVLAGVSSNGGWATGPGQVVMGSDPRGTHTPSWWNPANQSFKSNTYWNAVLPWFVVFDGVGNGATNTRVQLRNLVLYTKSKATGKWNLVRRSTGVSGELYPKTLQGDDVSTPNVRTESDGSTSVLPPSGNLVYHGWGSMDDIYGSDLAGLFITLQARLVKDKASGTDDRAKAKYLVHVGGDYYPTRTTRVNDTAPAYYFPGIGVSRAKMVSSDWQAYSFSTIDVGVEDPGGGVMSEAQFRAAPPPLE
jgi:hypothetical protein